MNRKQRRRHDVKKNGMNDAEFQAFLRAELERKARIFTPSRMALAVRSTMRAR